ncbi:MAG TPA: nucleotidyltransferase family protein [Acetobacteraceae bacterium]|jgi:hypothetical protein|nr:nucleotidyltransferase family protein [Acetobacteraceae bacterium]
MTEAEFLDCALTNRANTELLRRLRSVGLPDCYLTAGCLFQTVWNTKSGQPPEWGIKDYDVFYFDADTSWDAEDRAIREVAATTSDLPITVEVKNQARVHVWYHERFGRAYPPLQSAPEGIDRYLISCTCVGIEVCSDAVYAPNGLTDLANGVLRMNPLNRDPVLFRQKAESYQSRWPWLSILD